MAGVMETGGGVSPPAAPTASNARKAPQNRLMPPLFGLTVEEAARLSKHGLVVSPAI